MSRLTVREHFARLCGLGSFREIGPHAGFADAVMDSGLEATSPRAWRRQM